jgi:hypothetical protein
MMDSLLEIMNFLGDLFSIFWSSYDFWINTLTHNNLRSSFLAGIRFQQTDTKAENGRFDNKSPPGMRDYPSQWRREVHS